MNTKAEEKGQRVISEQIGPGIFRIWELGNILYEKTTPYQHVLIAHTGLGTALFCDLEHQSNELTQSIYHEGQFIPAVLLSKYCKRVLILGSSEGVITQVALKCGSQDIVHVEIDLECLRACAKHLSYGYSTNSLEQGLKGNGNVQIHINDAFEYIEQAIYSGEGTNELIGTPILIHPSQTNRDTHPNTPILIHTNETSDFIVP